MTGNSYRNILVSTSIIGSASVINVLFGLLKIKAAAVLLGPAGVGIIGLLTNLVSIAAIIVGLGFASSGTRQVAQSIAGDIEFEIALTRKTLLWGSLLLSFSGAGVFWLTHNVLARDVLNSAVPVADVRWLSLAVGLTVASASQAALLNGMRRIHDLAQISIFSALLSTVLGVAALLYGGPSGLITFVVAGPLSSFVIGHLYTSRVPKLHSSNIPLSVLAKQFGRMLKLGAAFMIGGLTGILGQFLVRILVQRELGTDALGYFQAAANISMTYLGFVLGAMAMDYYPRLSAIIHDPKAVNIMVNQQTEVALLLAAPILLAMIGLAPWVISLLYTISFGPSIAILQWQVLGDILKICSWPLGILMLAAGDGRSVIITEIVAMIVFLVFTWILLPAVGVLSTGISFFLMYLVFLPLVFSSARKRTDFYWTRQVKNLLYMTMIAAVFIFILSSHNVYIGAVAGVFTSGIFALRSLTRIAHAVQPDGKWGSVANKSQEFLNKINFFRK